MEGQTREEAVQAARDGRVNEGIAELRRLMAENPEDAATAFDLAVILTWQDRSREATDVFEKVSGVEIPEYVLSPMARAYRGQKRFAEAEKLVQQGLQRFPNDPVWPTLSALLLVDQDKPEEALKVLEPWAEKKPDDAEIWLAMGYAYQRLGDRFGILRAYGQALRQRPDNQEAIENMAGALSLLGAPYAAGALLGKNTPAAVKANQAGLMVRWGEQVVPLDPRLRFEGTDAALRRINKLLARPQPNRKITEQLLMDRIVALRDREDWKDAVAATEELRALGIGIPSYVRQAEADALLALRRPREAQAAYEDALQLGIADPEKEIEARVGVIFCLVEQEKFYRAFKAVDALADKARPELRMPEQRGPYPNWEWLDAKSLAAETRAFADMPASAWQRLRPLAEGAPANAELRRLRGGIAAAREWPRFSDEEIHIAASLEPENKGIQIALAESAVRRLRWREARLRTAELENIYPGDASVRRLRIDLAAHDSWEIYSEFNFHYEPGNAESESGGTAPGTGYDTSTVLYSPPIAEYWRIVAGFEYHEADVLEGDARRYREGVGLELRLPDFSLEGMFWYNHGSLEKPGGSLNVTWAPTDHWTFRAEGEIFAGDTPLRAILNGITSDLVGGSVQYTWNESQSLELSTSWYRFSDENIRYVINLDFVRTIVDLPHFDVNLRPGFYTSHNTKTDVPYFSPSQDVAATLGLDFEHVIWRRYERSFGQRLMVTGGPYWQENYGTGWIGSILYEQVYRHDPRSEIRYGVQANRNLYDGVEVPSLDFFIRINFLF